MFQLKRENEVLNHFDNSNLIHIDNSIKKFKLQTHLDNRRFPYKVAECVNDAPSIYIHPKDGTFS